jgi:hypothetical protein
MFDWWFELVWGLYQLDKRFFLGWKTSARCLANACAFSTLLLAQVPRDVQSGEGFLTCFSFLVAFQRE